MARKFSWFIILIGCFFIASGCQTTYLGVKNTAEGSAGMVKHAGEGFAEGAKKDWNWIKNADAWFRKNLW
ncbi:MAG: hypothetical protein ABIG46_05290 [Candidatus Omnitrophota bacterium]|nr:hypothetical protein [Candidatus Omnitrophota bacterium]